MKLLVLAALLATSANAQTAIGPSGGVSVDPFPITAEYQADFSKAEKCTGKPKQTEAVYLGSDAVYVEAGGKVDVLLDEYARRFMLDYCQ